jgi:hypothetical protein
MRGEDINDIERFIDPCEDRRTDKQIHWEGDYYSPSGIKARLIDSFGEPDIAQLGAIVAAFLILSVVRLTLGAIADNSIFTQLGLAAAAVLITLRYLNKIRGTQRLNRLNVGFIVIVGAVFLIFRGGVEYLFTQWGEASLKAIYMFIYIMFGSLGEVIRIAISLAVVIHTFIRVSVDKAEYAASVIMAAAAELGITYMIICGSRDVYNFFCIADSALMLISCIALKKSASRYIHCMTIAFCILSMAEIYGMK